MLGDFLLFPILSRDSLGWAVLLNFLVYVTLPVLLKYTGILLGLGSFATYVNAIIGLAKKENYFWEQVSASSSSRLFFLSLVFFGKSFRTVFRTYSFFLQK